MTQIEMQFYTVVMNTLRNIETQLEKQNEIMEKLVETLKEEKK